MQFSHHLQCLQYSFYKARKIHVYLDLTLSVSMVLNKLIKMRDFKDMILFKYESILLKTAKMTFSLAFFPHQVLFVILFETNKQKFV